MAGISENAVIWVAGEATGRDESGASVTIATSLQDSLLGAATVAAGVPSGAPAADKGPIYVNSANHKMYVWDSAAWIPVSGFNT